MQSQMRWNKWNHRTTAMRRICLLPPSRKRKKFTSQQRTEQGAVLSAASEAMPPPAPQSAAEGASLARYGVRAVDTGNEAQKTHGEAMYTAPPLRSACNPSSQKPAMQAFLWGIKRGILFCEREYPFAPCSANGAALPCPSAKIKKHHNLRRDALWSGRRGSNSLPPPWQGGALPDELRPQMVPQARIELATRGFSVRCSTN